MSKSHHTIEKSSHHGVTGRVSFRYVRDMNVLCMYVCMCVCVSVCVVYVCMVGHFIEGRIRMQGTVSPSGRNHQHWRVKYADTTVLYGSCRLSAAPLPPLSFPQEHNSLMKPPSFYQKFLYFPFCNLTPGKHNFLPSIPMRKAKITVLIP